MSAYQAKFPKGSQVQVVERTALEEFRQSWKLHDPLQEGQLAYAGQVHAVESVGFYFGGDVLYKLRDVPGIWHERCLEPPH